MKFTLALRTGGLMESPEWNYEGIKVIESNSLKDAIDKYAEEQGHTKSNLWNKENQTFWGWSVVDMIEEMKNKQHEKT